MFQGRSNWNREVKRPVAKSCQQSSAMANVKNADALFSSGNTHRPIWTRQKQPAIRKTGDNKASKRLALCVKMNVMRNQMQTNKFRLSFWLVRSTTLSFFLLRNEMTKLRTKASSPARKSCWAVVPLPLNHEELGTKCLEMSSP